ncbi:MAG: hypothetical protein AAGB05_11365 [Pseudomonadota bacterium]
MLAFACRAADLEDADRLAIGLGPMALKGHALGVASGRATGPNTAGDGVTGLIAGGSDAKTRA